MVARETEITFSQSRNVRKDASDQENPYFDASCIFVRKDASDQENPYFDASCIFVAVTCMTGALTEV